MEARIALTELTTRITDYDIDLSTATRTNSPTVYGFRTLPTTVTARR
jgi:hypothetical protein